MSEENSCVSGEHNRCSNHWGTILEETLGKIMDRLDDLEEQMDKLKKEKTMETKTVNVRDGSISEKEPKDHPESIVLNHVVLMAQQSLDPEYYEMFCKVHDRLIDIRHLQNKKLNT